jgi:hypothetical protein
MATSKRIATLAAAASFALALATVSGAGLAQAAAGSGAVTKHTFSGRYIASYHGFDASITGTTSEPNPPAIPYSVSGALTSDGKGNVKGFENIDYGSPGTGAAAQCTLTGTYTVSSSPGNGSVTLNLSPSCATVTCTGTTTPSCTPGSLSASSPSQWFCALSGPSGKSMVCTEMGEAASGTTFQTPISAVTWDRKD